jgi:hypothetical protein
MVVMPNKLYNEYLIHSTVQLNEFSQQLFTTLLNVAMYGELENLNDDLPNGTQVIFNEVDFRQVEDQNVKLLYEVLDKIEDVNKKLLNFNNLES